MKPRVSFITLGVDNLEKSMEFYRDGLGLSTKGIVGKEFQHGAVVFFDLQPGLKLALWPRNSIAQETGAAFTAGSGTEMMLSHNVESKEEVDDIMKHAAGARAKILKYGAKAFWGGYCGYFQDPDGHIWEIAWNPDLTAE